MRCMSLLLCLLLLLLTGCATPLTPAAARATAVAGGCWPYGTDQPPTPTPGTQGALVPSYPACPPPPGMPTATPPPTATPRPTVLPTPMPAFGTGGPAELGQQPGTLTVRSRQVHTPALAISPIDGRAAAAWYVWNGAPNSVLDAVWVRVQNPVGGWGASQTLTNAPVKLFLGGLGITWTVSDTLAVAFGDGGANGSTRIALVESTDGGDTWSAPAALGNGQISDLTSDAQGNLHAVVLRPGRDGAVVEGTPEYGIRAAAGGAWQWHPVGAGVGYNARLALLPLPGGGLRRFVLFTGTHGGLRLWSSDDGDQWQSRAVPLNRYLRDEHPAATSLLATVRGNGESLVAAAWSQPNGPGPVAGGVFAWVSLDGGATWGDEERIAQQHPDGTFVGENETFPGGFEPSLVYDRATDQLAASWIEDDLSRTSDRHASNTNRVVRTLLAARDLRDATWHFVVTPDDQHGTPPQLTDWGKRGALWGSADGRHHWLTINDERNQQARLYAAPVTLAALLVQGESQ